MSDYNPVLRGFEVRVQGRDLPGLHTEELFEVEFRRPGDHGAGDADPDVRVLVQVTGGHVRALSVDFGEGRQG